MPSRPMHLTGCPMSHIDIKELVATPGMGADLVGDDQMVMELGISCLQEVHEAGHGGLDALCAVILPHGTSASAPVLLP